MRLFSCLLNLYSTPNKQFFIRLIWILTPLVPTYQTPEIRNLHSLRTDDGFPMNTILQMAHLTMYPAVVDFKVLASPILVPRLQLAHFMRDLNPLKPVILTTSWTTAFFGFNMETELPTSIFSVTLVMVVSKLVVMFKTLLKVDTTQFSTLTTSPTENSMSLARSL